MVTKKLAEEFYLVFLKYKNFFKKETLKFFKNLDAVECVENFFVDFLEKSLKNYDEKISSKFTYLYNCFRRYLYPKIKRKKIKFVFVRDLNMFEKNYTNEYDEIIFDIENTKRLKDKVKEKIIKIITERHRDSNIGYYRKKLMELYA